MPGSAKCERCGKFGDFSEIKLYPLPFPPGRSEFLCEDCYKKSIKDLKNIDKKDGRCTYCGSRVPHNAVECPYCKKLVIRADKKVPKYNTCAACGSILYDNSKVCVQCGYSNKQPKNNKKIKNQFKSPPKEYYFAKEYAANLYPQNQIDLESKKKSSKKIMLFVGFVVTVIAIASVQAFFSNTSVEEIFGEGNINGTFDLISYEYIDNSGHPALQIIYNSTAKTNFKIYDEVRNPFNGQIVRTLVAKTDLKSGKNMARINMGDLYETVDDKWYFIKAECGKNVIFEDGILIIGPEIIINSVKGSWENNRYGDIFTEIDIKITNTGDMPAYIKNLNILIETKGPYIINFFDKTNKKLLEPRESFTIEDITIPDTFSKKPYHHITVDIMDYNENVLGSGEDDMGL